MPCHQLVVLQCAVLWGSPYTKRERRGSFLPVQHGAYYYQGALIASTGGLNDGKSCYFYVPYQSYCSVLEDRPILLLRE